MATELTNEEKIAIVNQHLKSIDYTIYGLELDLIEAEAIESESSILSSINGRIASANARRTALITERNSLTTPTE